jgi:hypothetical protein
VRKSVIIFFLLLPLVVNGETPQLPPENEIKTLLLDSLLAFNKAVRDRDFREFHAERLASQFQREFPLERFALAFQGFIEKGYDIANIAQFEPVFEMPPAINRDGLLIMQGYYPTRPNKVTFGLTYIYESSAWKLKGINVQVIPVTENSAPKPMALPPKKELKQLVSDSILLLNDAIQMANFDNFYSQTAKIWQKETTPEKLAEVFQSFTDQKADFSSIAALEPNFEEPPVINDDGYLVMKGSYPTKLSKLSFDLSYRSENDSWKLVSININLTPREEKPPKKKKQKSERSDDETRARSPDDE